MKQNKDKVPNMVIYLGVKMTAREAFDLLMGFYARDTGGPNWDMDDENSRKKVSDWLDEELRKSENAARIFPLCFNRLVVEKFLSEEATKKGYYCEDVMKFLNWLDDFDV